MAHADLRSVRQPVRPRGRERDEFGFTGEYGDTNGLLYLRARYYAPSQGRFFQLDPSRQEVNLYQYGYSNPILHVDPTGNDPITGVITAACIAFILGDGPLPFGDAACMALILGGAGVIAAGLVGAADVASDGQLNGEFRGCAPALSPPIFGENTRVRENVWEMEPIYQATPEPEPAPEPAPAPGRVPVPVQTQTPEPTRRLYHGTATTAVSQLLANIDLRTGNPNVDFGQGFYLTQSLRHAEERALQKGGPGNASVIVYDVPKYELLASSHLVFHSPSRAWTSFVLEHRATSGVNHSYDWVEGPVARRWNYVEQTVTAWPYPGYHQLSIHTEAARRLIQRSVTDVRIVR